MRVCSRGQQDTGTGAMWGKDCERRAMQAADASPSPEDKVGTVDLLPTATVLQDASVPHHSTLLKLRSVVGHFLERYMHGDKVNATPPSFRLHLCPQNIPSMSFTQRGSLVWNVREKRSQLEEEEAGETCPQHPPDN